MGIATPEQRRASDPDLEKNILKIVAALAPDRVDQVTADTVLIDDLGYDSSRLIELGIVLERRFGCSLNQAQIGAITIGDVVDLVLETIHTES